MKRTHLVGLVAAAALVVSTAPATAAARHDDRATAPDRIALPDGWLPEGITTDGKSLFSGSRADGAILKIDPRTGSSKRFRGAAGRIAVGIDHDSRRDVLWVAGGAGKEIRAQDADTGRVLATYTFPSAGERFVNDLTVTRTAVYATDSRSKELLVVPLSTRTKALPAASRARVLPLTGDLQLATGNNLNGIVNIGSKLVAVQSNTGRLFRIDPQSGATRRLLTGGRTFVNGDGLERGPGVLYVVRNRDNKIVVLDPSSTLKSAKVVGSIDPQDFATGIDVPTTVALLKGSLFAVNARFGVANPDFQPYWISRADAYRR